MPSVFSAAEDDLSDAVDAEFGRELEFRPYLAGPGGGRRLADPDRPTLTVIAIVDDDTGTGATSARGSSSIGTGDAISRTARRVSVSIDRRQFGAVAPRRVDRLVDLESGEVFEATDINLDAEGRYRITLSQVIKRDTE